MEANNNFLIKTEYFPSIPRDEIAGKCKHRLSMNDISTLGSGLAVVAAEFLKMAKNAPDNEGLYRCVFPEGVTGSLASFKDGSGYLGTILNGEGFAGQARWIPVEGASTSIPVDPVTIAIAVAMTMINKKLDLIQETQEEILQFLHQDKQSKLKGALNLLSDILEQYQFNMDRELWKTSKLTSVTEIKGKAEDNIIFYREEIIKATEKQKIIHGDLQTQKMKKELQNAFKYYQLATYIYAYSSFLEVLLGGNYRKDYLDRMTEKIRNYAYQYRVDYSKCYEQLEEFSRSSVQTKVLGGIGAASKFTGGLIAKVPVISKGPIDEVMIGAGKKIEYLSTKNTKKVMGEFRNNRDAGIQVFAENIEAINAVSNRYVELLFDKEMMYICG